MIVDCTLWPPRFSTGDCGFFTNYARLWMILLDFTWCHFRCSICWWSCDTVPSCRQWQHWNLLLLPAAPKPFQHQPDGSPCPSKIVGGQGDHAPWLQLNQTWRWHSSETEKVILRLDLNGVFHSISLIHYYSLALWTRGFNVYEIALNFAPSQHNGDRRKTSQQCYLFWIQFPIQTIDIQRNVKLHLISPKNMDFESHAVYRSWGHCWDAREELQRAILEKQGLPRLNFWGGSGKSHGPCQPRTRQATGSPLQSSMPENCPIFCACGSLQTYPKNQLVRLFIESFIYQLRSNSEAFQLARTSSWSFWMALLKMTHRFWSWMRCPTGA